MTTDESSVTNRNYIHTYLAITFKFSSHTSKNWSALFLTMADYCWERYSKPWTLWSRNLHYRTRTAHDNKSIRILAIV